MKPLLFTVACLLLIFSCSETEQKWILSETIDLGQITPIGFTFHKDNIWIADGDHNQLVEINTDGTILQTITEFERPMHLDSDDSTLYIPEYGSDQIMKFENGQKSILEIPDSLDAPAGVAVYKNEIAIADFYKHRILFFNGQKWMSFGKEGKKRGELYYPTDVQILSNKIVVADAYNNRVQVFDKKGKSMSVIGEEQKMNAATGVFADESEIFITDFENNRVLIFNHNGELLQTIDEQLEKPTEVLKVDDTLYIANYKGKNILKYLKK